MAAKRLMSGAPAGIRKVRKCVGSYLQIFKAYNYVARNHLYNFSSGTTIKTCVDGYNLRLISRRPRCEDHRRHYGAMVRSDLSTDPHVPLLDIAVKTYIRSV